jgi:hypothetical protein
LSYALALFLCSGGDEPLANDDVWQTIGNPAHSGLMFPQESHQPVHRFYNRLHLGRESYATKQKRCNQFREN